MRKYFFIVLASTLLGCGGGSGGDSNGESETTTSDNESVAGIWEGAGETTKNITGNIAGLVASNGKSFFLTDAETLTYGDFSVSGSSLSFSGIVHGDDDPDSVTMSGSVTAGDSINVNYSTPDESGTIVLSKASSSTGVYDRASTVEKLEGSWNDDVTDSDGTWIFTIQNNGIFSAIRVTDNCILSGSFSTIDSTKNEYSIIATVTSCNGFNGSYTGLAFTSDANTFSDNVISLAISNSQNGGFFEAIKQ